ncbi:helix-turn-helix domain-containing protein [Paenibacillus mesotrionivorans]|uniref:Helix-turn-helix domain-containing protein n=1 Tax=Paenibacillus mesotrionivorans TaxID=3160968 RepID=A0ACC7NTB1_9BACL
MLVTSNNLALVRRYYGVTAARLAGMLDVHPSFISQIEIGHRPLPEGLALKIEQELGLTSERIAKINALSNELNQKTEKR